MGLSVSLVACGPLTASPAPSAGETATTAGAPDAAIPDASSHGEFVSRVLATGELAAVDPILAPGTASQHTHLFFGANNVTPTSTRADLAAQPTSAKNASDTAAYWVPQLFFQNQSWTPGCTGSPPNLTCGNDVDTTLNLRVYYTAGEPRHTIQMPRVMMVTGYPHAKADPHSFDENSMSIVRYHCGADTGANVVTPISQWPYTCTNYTHDGFDGVVMDVDFPDCWNGTKSGLLNGETMAQYIDPHVERGHANDLSYATNGKCGDTQYRIPRVSIHVHSKIVNPSSDGSTILPSDCSAQQGFPFPCMIQGEPPTSGPGSIALGLASDARTPGGWYTMHADFVQSWQMGTVDDPFSTLPPPDQDAQEQPGTLNDLTEDCLRAGVTCSFQPDKHGGFVTN